MITCQSVNKSIKAACAFNVECSHGITFQLKIADYEEVLARAREEQALANKKKQLNPF